MIPAAMSASAAALVEVEAVASTPAPVTSAAQAGTALPHQGAIRAIRGLRDVGYDLVYVTARPERIRWPTAGWIDRHVGGAATELLMRHTGDRLPPGEVLSTLYYRAIAGHYRHLLAVCALTGGHCGMWAGICGGCVVVDDRSPDGAVWSLAPGREPAASRETTSWHG